MAIRTIIVLLMSLLCGTSAAVGVNYLTRQKPVVAAPPKTTKILVAAIEIPRGAPLKSELLKWQDWPEALLPPGAVVEMEKIVDRAALTGFVPGEPILLSKISAGGVGASSLVRPGMRAFTIETASSSAGVGGFILPGNRVDVLLTMAKMLEAAGGAGTWTLLQNVEILAAGQRLDQADSQGAKNERLANVTLMVTPEMATKLTLAQSLGDLTLTLRNDSDNSIADTPPITTRDLLFLQEAIATTEKEPEPPPETPEPAPAVVAAPPAEQPREIVALRGNSFSLIRVNPVSN